MENLPSTAAEAKAIGSKKYYTGVPCPKGHDSPRRTANTSCLACLKSYPKAAEAKRRYRAKARLAKRGGCTVEQKEQIISDQNGCCAICGSDKKTLFIDHCHNTNRIRAALCMNCNTALGQVKDKPELLRKMAEYIEQHAGRI